MDAIDLAKLQEDKFSKICKLLCKSILPFLLILIPIVGRIISAINT